MTSALKEGYATASNDTGHKGGSAEFALGHPEKVIDFEYRGDARDGDEIEKAIVAAFYDRGPRCRPTKGYLTGGRQGMMEAQRYPGRLDGIIAGAPDYNQVHLNESQVSLQVDLLREVSLRRSPEQSGGVRQGRDRAPATSWMASRTASSTIRRCAGSTPRLCCARRETLRTV